MEPVVPATGGLALKRAVDLVAAALGLVLSIPIQIVVFLLVLKNLGRPVFFRQDRPGRNGEIFTLIKFRTMMPVHADKDQKTDEQRLTKFGAALRSTSLDELPTLINVLRGDMSLVGPRPLLVEYLDRYTAEQRLRHWVRPGVTGLAQVRGRNSLSWDEKFALDIEYVQKRSFWLDIRIILETVTSVMSRKGINAPDSATMPAFEQQKGTDVEVVS